jgi:hypothetical protein
MFGVIMPVCNRIFCGKQCCLSALQLFHCKPPLFHCISLWTTVRLHGKKLQNATKSFSQFEIYQNFIIQQLNFCKLVSLFCDSVSFVRQNLRGLREGLKHKIPTQVILAVHLQQKTWVKHKSSITLITALLIMNLR